MLKPWRTRLRTAGKLACVNLVVLVLVDLGFHWRYLAHLPRFPQPSFSELSAKTGVPAPLLRSVGAFVADDPRHDFTKLRAAHPGTIRIAALGDSNTFGDEVPPGFDYPSLLEKTLRGYGFDNVEVVNFGNSWHGLGQAYRIWDQFARTFDPDFILLGPALFSERDQTFHHALGIVPEYVHGRYVLDGDGVRFEDVVGGTDRASISSRYYAFIPPFEYLRFDRNPPSFLRCLLPAGRHLANPFYYSSLSPEREADELNRRLLAAFGHDKPTVLVHRDKHMVDIAATIEGISAAHFERPDVMPYHRLNGHSAPIGNRLIAAQYAQMLLGKRAIEWKELRWLGPIRASASGALATAMGMELLIGHDRVATLLWLDPSVDAGKRAEHPVNPRDEGVRSFLVLYAADRSPVEVPWLALDHPLHEGSIVALDLDGHRTPLATVQLAFANGDIGLAKIPATWAAYFDPGAQQFMTGLRLVLRPGQVGRILVDDEPIYEVRSATKDFQSLSPWNHRLASWIAGPTDDLDVEAMPARGTADLKLAGEPLQTALVAYQVKSMTRPNDRGRMPAVMAQATSGQGLGQVKLMSR